MGDHTTLRTRSSRAGLAVAALCALGLSIPAQVTPNQLQPANPQGQGPGQGKKVDVKTEGEWIYISINEAEGLSLQDFIKTAEAITGKVFVYNKQELSSAPDPTVTYLGTLKIRKTAFFAFFQTMLYIKGFACLLRDLKDSEIVQIVNMNGTQRTEISNSAKYVPPDEIPNYASQTGVQILTSIALEHVNAQNAQNSLRPFFASATAQAGGLLFGTVGNNRAFLLQGFGPQVYAAYQLLKLVDVPAEAADHEVRVVRLEHAAAEELETVINDILNDRNRQRAPAAAGVTGAEIPGQAAQMKIMPYQALNAILLAGTKEQIIEAQDLIARLDVPVEVLGGDLSVLRLKNVLADDLEKTLKTFINEDQAAETAAAAGAQAGAQARKVRKTVVIAHKESNSLLLSGTATKLATLKKLIEGRLDARQPQVLVECAVVELSTSDLKRLGVELGLIDIKENGDFTRPFGFTSFGASTFSDTDDNGIPDTRLPDFENPLQGLTGGIISGGDFGIPVLVNALGQNNTANILSLPSVVVNNNQEAMVKTAENRPTQTTNQGNATTQSGFGGFQDAGIELNISPSISSNNYLRLNVHLTVSRFLTAYDPNSATPGVKSTREVKTQVTLPSGSTMVLGGVIEDAESETESGIPLLQDIPILGFLFKAWSSEKRKTNLYFFLTPHILDEDDFEDLREISFRRKLDAATYIGDRRLQVVDPKWRGKETAERLDDAGATIEDIDRRGGFQMPSRSRPAREGEKLPAGTQPAGPALPGSGTTSGPTRPTKG